jgi:hypothetical protein
MGGLLLAGTLTTLGMVDHRPRVMFPEDQAACGCAGLGVGPSFALAGCVAGLLLHLVILAGQSSGRASVADTPPSA